MIVATKQSRLFMPAAVGTVVMGIGAAVLFIVHMRQPKPVVIEKPPVDHRKAGNEASV